LKQVTQGNTNKWNTLLSWITTAPQHMLSSQLLMLQLILVWAVINAIGYAIGYQLLLQEAPIIPLWRLVLLVVLYIISRSRYYNVASLGLVVWMIAQPYMTLIIPEAQHELTMMTSLSIVAIPLMGLLLPQRRLLYIITLIVIINLLIIQFVTQQIDPLMILILMVIAASIMLCFVLWYEVFQVKIPSSHPYESLIEMSPDIMAVLVKSKFAYINPAGLRLLGATNESEIIGKFLDTIILSSIGDTPSSNKYMIGNSHLGEMIIQSVETIQPLDGDSYRALVTLTPFDQDGVMATLLTAKSLPSSLSQSEQILESTVAILVVRQNKKIVYVSSQFDRLTGYSREEVHSSENTPLRHTYVDDRDRFSRWLEEAEAGTNESKTIEYRMYREDRSIIWVSTMSSAIRYNGRPALLTTTVDITPYRSESPHKIQTKKDLQRYRTMFDMMNDYTFLIEVLPDESFKFVWVSDAFEKITGFNSSIDSFEDITEKTTFPADEAIMQKHIAQLMRGEMSVVEHRIVTKAGAIRWVRKYAYPEVEDGRTTLIYGSASDITDRVEAEEVIKNSALQQSVIAEIGMVAVNGNLDVEEFAQQTLNLVTQLMKVPWCVLIEYHQDEQQFTVHSIVGESVSGEIESNPGDRNSYLGYVLHQNDPIVVVDWSKETRFKQPDAYVDLGIQTSLGVVIPMQDQPFGILNIHDSTPHQFSSAHINLLQTVANIIGAYIQQRQTQIAEREYRMMAEALINIAAVLNSQTELDDILQLILDFVSQIVPVVDTSNIMLVDREKEIVTIAIRHTVKPDIYDAPAGQEIPLSDVPIFIKMIETGEPVILGNVNEAEGWHVVPETAWIQSYIGAPIFAGEECIGVVSLDSAHQNAFTPEHVTQMKAFLDQASIAIQNAQHAEDLTQEVENRTQELQSERAHLQAILNSTGEGIFYSRGQSKTMLFINHALADMMGYESQELWNKSSHIFRPDDLTEEEIKIREDIRTAVRTLGLTRAELRFKRKNGTIIMVGVTVSQVSFKDGILESVTVVRDISKEKAIEAQKEIFISNAAHELRSPITTLNTRLYLMRSKESAPHEDIAKLDVVIQKMNALVAGLLDWSRFESGRIKLNLQSVILQTILDDVMAYQLPEAEKKQMTLNYVASDEPITMIADSLRFNQVLTNFISNSISYTLDGGNIDVKANYADESHDIVIIEVIDNGIGIDEESLKTIFQPFSLAHNNTTDRGIGLGLSISKQIVEAHGGHIKVESVEGEGSRFILYMPTTASHQEGE
jgi:PAS domain S-box-containing protein